MKVFVDYFTYRSPDSINESNYKRTFYKELSEQENARYRSLNDEKKREFVEDILLRPENDKFAAARIRENNQERIVLVRLFSPWGINVDQVVFNVLLPEVQDSNIDLATELLNYGADGFRADMMNWLLKKYLRAYFELLPEAQKKMFDELPEPLKYIIAKTKAGAQDMGKTMEYIAETYNEEDTNKLLRLGVDRVYYPDVFMEYVRIVREGASVQGLKQKIEQILAQRQQWMIYPSNPDQIALRKLGGPRKGFAMFIQALNFLGLRALVDLTKEWIDGFQFINIPGGTDEESIHGHPFPPSEEYIEKRRDFYGLLNEIKHALWAEVVKDFFGAIGKYITEKEDSAQFLEVEEKMRDRFLALTWRNEKEEWVIVAVDMKPKDAKESVQVYLPFGFEDGSCRAEDILQNKDIPVAIQEKEGRKKYSLAIDFNPGEEYKIVAVCLQSSSAVVNQIVKTDRGRP